MFGIVYQVDSLSLALCFGLVGLYPVPLPAEYLSAFSSCLEWPFCILAVCGVLFIVEFPHCGWGCQGFLVREACVGVLVGGAGFLLSGVH